MMEEREDKGSRKIVKDVACPGRRARQYERGGFDLMGASSEQNILYDGLRGRNSRRPTAAGGNPQHVSFAKQRYGPVEQVGTFSHSFVLSASPLSGSDSRLACSAAAEQRLSHGSHHSTYANAPDQAQSTRQHTSKHAANKVCFLRQLASAAEGGQQQASDFRPTWRHPERDRGDAAAAQATP